MAARQDYPSSDPAENVANLIESLRSTGEANAKAVARGALPEPLLFRVTPVAPGPPPTFRVEIVNPFTGAAILLGII